jgi:valyl-tRNA synthetase
MPISKRYNAGTSEAALQAHWSESGVYHFDKQADGPVYAVDTPPPTVSGHLHLGHVYSYSHADFIARFWRMNGYNVFYPMGYDDNGLPTERLVEERLGVTADQIGRQAFIEECLAVSEEAEREYRALWQRLGLSVDWRYTYRTIDERSRRLAQWSFIDLYGKGLAYRQQAPAIWCPQCRTAIAQAEVDDLERESAFLTLAFSLDDGRILPIATTRPELLPACVAVFVHPEDGRYQKLIGSHATVPLFGQVVPILADPAADPQKGTGAVMCCTFGDTADVAWWRAHQVRAHQVRAHQVRAHQVRAHQVRAHQVRAHQVRAHQVRAHPLPLIEAIGHDGRMTAVAGELAGLTIQEARRLVSGRAAEAGLLLEQRPVAQTVRVHERCDTPVEFIVTQQWFVRLLENKETFLELGEQIAWYPPHMKARYRQWVENLNWDWCISRRRAFGVPFPVWYCTACGQLMLAEIEELPVDPSKQQPARPCACGSRHFEPETDVMDTWATSSLSPQIVGGWNEDEDLYRKVFPMSLRPQAHEIIRTWAFYTIVKSHYHFGALPWSNVAISGWGLAPEGSGKISKSRGSGPVAPLAMIEQYSADAVRYWAAGAGLGRDTTISEEKIQAGARLVNKLWNVANLSRRFLGGYRPPETRPSLTPSDRWILSRLQGLIGRCTGLFRQYDYAGARSETELFFWTVADNYLELSKKRLYEGEHRGHAAARYTLFHTLLATLKLFAPFLPYVTEAVYQAMLAEADGSGSIHRSRWPVADEKLVDEAAEQTGEVLLAIATAVRRYKSERNLSLAGELAQLQLQTADEELRQGLTAAEADLISVSRARQIVVGHGDAKESTAVHPRLRMIIRES